MWRRASAAAACLLLVSAAAFAQTAAVDTIETSTFKFSLPSGWKVTSKTGSVETDTTAAASVDAIRDAVVAIRWK